MKKVTFALNYHKKKALYSENDELSVSLRYYFSISKNQSKVKKITTNVRCKIKDWDPQWNRTDKRWPIKSTDPNYITKNTRLTELAASFKDNPLGKNLLDAISPSVIKPELETLKSKEPQGPLKDKWTTHKNNIRLVNPSNKRLIDVIVVGTGLAGASAASSLAEMGYNVKAFCFQDSPRRAHSIAAQGGINAAKNYQNDGDSVYRLFYDTVKGGDYRSR